MILTGKSREDFLSEYGYLEWKNSEIYLNALIIEWFDSVGIFIQIDVVDGRYMEDDKKFFLSGILGFSFNDLSKTRQEATTEAIKKANEIYNQRFEL